MEIAELVKLGDKIIPVNGKSPAPGWVGKKHKTTGTPEEWAEDPKCTGTALKLGNLVVVDVDTKKVAVNIKIDTVIKRVQSALGTKSTFIVESGYGKGSCHMYFRLPKGKELDRHAINEALEGIEVGHIDILSGSQYCILPGSQYLNTMNEYKVYKENPVTWLPEVFCLQEQDAPVYDMDVIGELQYVRPSKYLEDTKSRHRSIMKDAMFILAQVDGNMRSQELALQIQMRTENSPCATKTEKWTEQGKMDFYKTTAEKVSNLFIPNTASVRVKKWEEHLLTLRQKGASDGAMILAATLLKAFKNENALRISRSYRQLAVESVLSTTAIMRYRKELEELKFIKWYKGNWVTDNYSEWKLLAPPRKIGFKLKVDLTSPAFTHTKSGGLGHQAAWVIQAAKQLHGFKLHHLASYAQKQLGASSDIKNCITRLVKAGIIIKDGKMWELNKKALKSYGKAKIYKQNRKDKLRFYRTERENFGQYVEKLKAIWTKGLTLLEPEIASPFPVRYRQVKNKCSASGIDKKHYSTIWRLANS